MHAANLVWAWFYAKQPGLAIAFAGAIVNQVVPLAMIHYYRARPGGSKYRRVET